MGQTKKEEAKGMVQTSFPGSSTGVISFFVLVVVILGVTISAMGRNATAKVKLAQKEYSVYQGKMETSNRIEISGSD